MQTNLLFVYGTPLNADNEFAQLLKQNSIFYADGRFRGRLYNAGDYPAAIADEQDAGFVYGKIYLLNNAGEVLTQLDDYEGIGPEYPEPHEYIRKLITISDLSCWVYLYNWSVDKFELIDSGRWTI